MQNKEIVEMLNTIFNNVRPHGTVGDFKPLNGSCPGYYVIPGSCVEMLLKFKEYLTKPEIVKEGIPFTGGNLPHKFDRYILIDPLVRTIVDKYITDPTLRPSTVEQVIESICIAALNIKEDYFKLLLTEYEKNSNVILLK